MSTTEDQIKKMYSAQLDAQKEQLKQGYIQADAEYAAEKEKAQKATDANLTRTAVEAQKAAVNNAELHNAYGLSSGTRAQARLAQENQLQADLTALRMQQQELDTDVERQRTLLSQQYQSAIRQAQAENDLAKAEALYKEAQAQQERLLAQQQAQQEALLAQQQAQREAELEAAKLMAEAGDYSRYAQIYNLTPAEVATLMGTSSPTNANPGGNLLALNNRMLGLTDGGKMMEVIKDASGSSPTTGSRTHGGSSGKFGGSATGSPNAASVTSHSSLVQTLDLYTANGMTAAEAAAMIRAAADEGIINSSQMGQLLARYAKGM